MIRAVPEASATFGPRPHGVMHKYVAIAADHSTMVKFAHNSDPHYTIVRERLSECVRKASRTQHGLPDRPLAGEQDTPEGEVSSRTMVSMLLGLRLDNDGG